MEGHPSEWKVYLFKTVKYTEPGKGKTIPDWRTMRRWVFLGKNEKRDIQTVGEIWMGSVNWKVVLCWCWFLIGTVVWWFHKRVFLFCESRHGIFRGLESWCWKKDCLSLYIYIHTHISIYTDIYIYIYHLYLYTDKQIKTMYFSINNYKYTLQLYLCVRVTKISMDI